MQFLLGPEARAAQPLSRSARLLPASKAMKTLGFPGKQSRGHSRALWVFRVTYHRRRGPFPSPSSAMDWPLTRWFQQWLLPFYLLGHGRGSSSLDGPVLQNYYSFCLRGFPLPIHSPAHAHTRNVPRTDLHTTHTARIWWPRWRNAWKETSGPPPPSTPCPAPRPALPMEIQLPLQSSARCHCRRQPHWRPPHAPLRPYRSGLSLRKQPVPTECEHCGHLHSVMFFS